MNKIFLLLVLLLVLTSCFGMTNTDVEPIKQNITGNKVIKIKNSSEKIKSIYKISKNELEESMKTISGSVNIKEKIEKLNETNSPIEEFVNKDKLTVLEGTLGQYEKIINTKKKNCLIFNRDVDCKTFKYNVSFDTLYDNDNSAIFNNNTSIEFDGKTFNFKSSISFVTYFDMEHLLIVNKKGYIGYYNIFHTYYSSGNKENFLKPILLKYNYNKKINSDKRFSYKTNNFEFIIEPNTFIDNSGDIVKGEVDLYLFDINNDNSSIFLLKTFDRDSLSFLGKGINNTSIALVRAFLGDEELKIDKPIKVLSNLENITTFSKIKGIKSIPKNIALKKDDILKYKLPFIGNLNYKSGIWLSSDIKVLNNLGDIEFLLY